MIGALWEIYEFSFDALLGLNMQKHTTAEGAGLVGKEALSDTMKDLIIDALAALAVAVVGLFQNLVVKKRRGAERETRKNSFPPVS